MTTSTRDLAQDLADKYDTDPSAMREAVETYAGQVSDDDNLWDADAEELTDAGVEVVSGAIAASQADDTAIDGILDELIAAQDDLDGYQQKLKRRDNAVRAAIAASVPVIRIAELTGLNRSRIYQIRDGRR